MQSSEDGHKKPATDKIWSITLEQEWQRKDSSLNHRRKLFGNASTGPRYPLPDAVTAAVPSQLNQHQWQQGTKGNPRGWEEKAVFCLSGQKRILAHGMNKVCQRYQEITAISKSDVSQRFGIKTAFQVKTSFLLLRNIP